VSSTKENRKGLLGALDRAYAFVEGARGIIMILSALSAGGITGTVLASDGDTASRVDSLEVRIDSLEARQNRMELRQLDMFSAQVEADTALRAVLERRVANRAKAAAERRAVENLINLGGSP
jgi:hypothetical protein